MRYQCEVFIVGQLEDVVSLFLEHMVQNQSYTPGSQVTFSQSMGDNQAMTMKETIESVNLPHEIINTYEVEGVWNRCIHQFDAKDNGVLYTMDTEFVFQVDMPVPEEAFRAKTQGHMDSFKQLCEGK